MGARMRNLVLALAWVGCASLLGTPSAPVPRVQDPIPIAAAVGAGIGGRIMCVGCAIGFVGSAGATIFGMALMATLLPEVFGACVYICIKAY